MLILTIRTDKPEAELGLYQDQQQMAVHTWQAHRQLAETLHHKIRDMLVGQKQSWQDVQGIVVFKGPGSFTGLRIGLSVANAFATAKELPIIATAGNDWINQGLQKLVAGDNDKLALPEYGSLPHITQAKK